MKGSAPLKFDEFGLIMVGAVIFIGILALGFTTPSEFPPRLSPAEVKMSLDPGSYESFTFNISGRVSGVNVSFGGQIADWMSTDVYDYGALTRTTPVKVRVNVPTTATAGTYKGNVIVSGKEGVSDIGVTVTVSAVKRLESKTYQIGDFRAAYVDDVRLLGEAAQAYVSKSYLYERPLGMVGILEAHEVPIAAGGIVRFVVEDTNNYGDVIVVQNGREIFSETVGPGEVIVPLNASDIRKSNSISIRAENPGIFFWTENVYSVRDAALEVYLTGAVDKSFNFSLVPDQYNRADHVQIVFNVDGHSEPLPQMKIWLNGRTIYQDVPPTGSFNKNIAADVFGSPLELTERNTLTFGFEQEADYQVSDAALIVYSRAR